MGPKFFLKKFLLAALFFLLPASLINSCGSTDVLNFRKAPTKNEPLRLNEECGLELKGGNGRGKEKKPKNVKLC